MNFFLSAGQTEKKRRERALIGKSTWFKPWRKEPGVFTPLSETGQSANRMENKGEDKQMKPEKSSRRMDQVRVQFFKSNCTSGLQIGPIPVNSSFFEFCRNVELEKLEFHMKIFSFRDVWKRTALKMIFLWKKIEY